MRPATLRLASLRLATVLLWSVAATLRVAAAAAASPDLTGVWSIVNYRPAIKTTEGGLPPMTPEAAAVYKKHLADAARGDKAFDETTLCLPPGLPRLMLVNEPFEILQRDKVIYFVHQLNRMPRRAYLGEALPQDPDPFYLGYSVAKWDGDALVIESSGFREGTLLDDAGLPHSEALHLTERYQLSKDGKTLRVHFTIDDPKTFTHSWSTDAQYVKRPRYEIPEEVCADPYVLSGLVIRWKVREWSTVAGETAANPVRPNPTRN